MSSRTSVARGAAKVSTSSPGSCHQTQDPFLSSSLQHPRNPQANPGGCSQWVDIMFSKSPSPKMDDAGTVGIGDLMAALLIAVIGLALVPTIQSSANNSLSAVGGTSTAAGGLINLLPLFYVVVIVAGLVAFIVFKHKEP